MLKNYFTLLAIGIIWGSQFIFQETALTSFSPVWIGTLRAVLGAITLFFICRLMGINSSGKQWSLYALIGLLEATIPFVLIPWGQQEISSSIAAILMGTIPFYALLLAPIFIKGAKITLGNSISVVIGFSGLIVLFYPDLTADTAKLNFLSAIAIMIAAVCFAIALLLLNRVKNEHPLIVARNVLTMASVQLLLFAFATTPFIVTNLPISSLFSIGYLGIMCAGVVYYLYMMSIKNAGAVFTSMTNYLVPAVGVFIAAALTNDRIEPTTWLALGIILFALLMNQIISQKNQQSAKQLH